LAKELAMPSDISLIDVARRGAAFVMTLIAGTLLTAVPAWGACTTSPPTPSFSVPGEINTLWTARGGCASKFGDAIAPARRNAFTGGLSQDFAQGQIVVFDRWASGGAGKCPHW
jgi:hypothetical protein